MMDPYEKSNESVGRFGFFRLRIAKVPMKRLCCKVSLFLTSVIYYALVFTPEKVVSLSVNNRPATTTKTTTAQNAKNSKKPAQLTPSVLSKVRYAMDASTRSAMNITAAYDACEVWSQLLTTVTTSSTVVSTDLSASLPLDDNLNIKVICYALYASCLVRIGRDDIALKVYNTCLNDQKLAPYLSEQTRYDMILGKAYALQRVLKYKSAFESFQQLLSLKYSSEKATCGAVTCLLRQQHAQGRIDLAKSILQDYFNSKRPDEQSFEAAGMLGTLILYSTVPVNDEQTPNVDQASWQDGLAHLEQASQASLLYYWIYHVLLSKYAGGSNTRQNQQKSNIIKEYSFIDLIQINQSPFDDPNLIELDDKVNLHRLLLHGSDTTPATTAVTTPSSMEQQSVISSFWPKSIVLPIDLSQYDDEDLRHFLLSKDEDKIHPEEKNPSNNLWFVKERAGYGSHGNKLVTTSQALIMASEIRTRVRGEEEEEKEEEERLLQQMVNPPCLLMGGRKFSLRVYAVIIYRQHPEDNCRNESQIYLSTQGLVKFASIPLHQDKPEGPKAMVKDEEVKIDNRMHMTNSGRETNMIQKDLTYLKDEFDRHPGWSYDQLWSDIQTIVRTVMKCYYSRHNRGHATDERRPEQQQQLHDVLRIPKIIAFDLVLDRTRRPWLVEVNRFPGLEPRDGDNTAAGDGDRRVKHQVVKDAWICATSSSLEDDDSGDNHPLKSVLDKLDCDHTTVYLERLL